MRLRAAVLVAGLALLSGCATWQGARLYASGTRALDRGDVSAAIEDLERASALVPERSEVRNHLGLADTEAGRSADALVAFERAVELDCENQAAQRNLVRARAAARGEGTAPESP